MQKTLLTLTLTFLAAGSLAASAETIALMGNTLPERFQHDGWLETLAQREMPERQLVFRNLAFPGDRVAKRPRNKGFASPEEYLKLVKADQVWAFFGYNESFDGESGLQNFKNQLSGMVDSYRNLQPNGEAAPEIVLFSPIAHEDLDDPNYPSGLENNKRLARYTSAIREVAEEKQTGFMDLFHPSLELYAANDAPLTINGVHLNALGNQLLAKTIVSQITIVDPADLALTAADEPLRQAVLDKNWCWFNRYRATDGNDVWGGRSKLSFVDGQTNAEVLQHELKMLDVMTANRDQRIHALAKGLPDPGVDDSNVPPPIEVESNVGGKSKSSSAQKEGSLSYLSGQEGLEKITVPEDYQVNLFADEDRFPEVVNPVQLQVDGQGRLWAAAWHTYPKWEPLKPMDDQLVILPDADRDGVADRAITFAKIHNPLGFEFWNGGVLVASQPDLVFLRDNDGDDVADERRVILSGFGSADTHHAANNLIIGPGGGLYWQSGIFLQNNWEHPWGPSLNTGASALYRFDPRRFTVQYICRNSPNPHGISFDRWGYQYISDGTGGRLHQVRMEGDGFKNYPLANKKVRPVPASEILSSGHFPDEMQQTFMVSNAIGFLGIKQYELQRDPSTGVVQGGDPVRDLFQSSDKNFRPTDTIVGSDGALYVADWHNVIIGHMQHNIRDPNRDKQHGRIYRMTHKERPLQAPVAIDGQPVEVLLAHLTHPVDGVRQRTRIELGERDVDEVIPAARKWIAGLNDKDPDDALAFAEALWLHQQFNVRDTVLLNAVKNSPDPHFRIAAARVEHFWGPADPTRGTRALPEEGEEKVVVKTPSHLTGTEAELFQLGAEVYHRDAHCVTCHQPNGEGLAKIYPPLTGSKWVTDGDTDRLIKLTLNGLMGRIEVKGVVYDTAQGVPPMTPFKALLDDQELAAVLTYVRNQWGHQAGAVDPKDVGRVREATKDRHLFYDPQKLLEAHPFEK